MGEFSCISNLNVKNLEYIMVGTSIGAGFFIKGMITHGLVHPEFGHIFVPYKKSVILTMEFVPFTKIASKDWQVGRLYKHGRVYKQEKLPEDHPAWQLEGEYLSLAIANLVCNVSPEAIIFGGGVISQKQLYPIIHEKTQKPLNDYIQDDINSWKIDEYIRPPVLRENEGLLGALGLAKSARK